RRGVWSAAAGCGPATTRFAASGTGQRLAVKCVVGSARRRIGKEGSFVDAGSRLKDIDVERKRALITGVSGQDGSYLAEYLVGLGYEVYGLIRRNSITEHQQ